MTSIENLQSSALSSSDVDSHPKNSAPHLLNHGDTEAGNSRDTEAKRDFTEEEVKSILEVSASTGKFWHDWEILREILSFRLKQVLAQYPESQMGSDMIGPQQSSLSRETFQELVKRLDEALLCFIEGPPFTLQRLCEILLTPQSIYSNLSKLALALEKNLLVTSTLIMCTEPYQSTIIQNPAEFNNGNEAIQVHPDVIENGIEAMISDGDEEMAEAEAEAEAEVEVEAEAGAGAGAEAETDEDNKHHTDTDATEEKMVERISETSETSPEPTTVSDPSVEASPSNEELNPATL